MTFTRLQAHWLGVMGAYALLNHSFIVGATLMAVASYALRVARKLGL